MRGSAWQTVLTEVMKVADEVKDLRKLVIKSFHMNSVEWGEHNDIKVDGNMTVSKEMLDGLAAEEEYIDEHHHGYYTDLYKSSWQDWGWDYAHDHRRLCNAYGCGCEW